MSRILLIAEISEDSNWYIVRVHDLNLGARRSLHQGESRAEVDTIYIGENILP